MDAFDKELKSENERLRSLIGALEKQARNVEQERWVNLESKVDKILVLLVGNEDEDASKRAVFQRLRIIENDIAEIHSYQAERARKRLAEQTEKRQEFSALKVGLIVATFEAGIRGFEFLWHLIWK